MSQRTPLLQEHFVRPQHGYQSQLRSSSPRPASLQPSSHSNAQQQQQHVASQRKTRAGGSRSDPQIFLRACHSPWPFINQQHLIMLRGLVATYMLATLPVLVHFGVEKEKLGWLVAFDFANISYLIQTIYQIIVFVWTYMHYKNPHTEHGDGFGNSIKRFLAPPRSNNWAKNHQWFSTFYAAATVLPHVATFMYWAVMIPKHETTYPANETFGHGEERAFYIFSKYGLNSLIALVEILVFSSMKTPEPLWSHLGSIALAMGMYVGWTFVGYVVTDKFSYPFLDHHQVGAENAVIGTVAFLGLGEIMFFVVYGLNGAREWLSTKLKQSDYQTLPQ